MMQVLINFVTNAIKFTDEGSIRFGYRLENDNASIRFYVTDTGCGISEENLPKIFGRFIQLNNFVQGTGLGLAISEMIVKHMGGEIGADSVLGGGSTFWFTLPYKPAEKDESACVGQNAAVDRHPASIHDTENIKILIAEDNESNYRLFEAILKKRYTIIHAWNGQEAVDLFAKEHPHLVLTDIRMPVLDGYEVRVRIRQQDQSVPVIAVTAFSQSEDKKRIFAAGFDEFVSKPVNSAVLHDKIKENLNRVYGSKI